MVLNDRRDQSVHFLEVQIHTHKKARREFNRLRASFLKFALESLEVRPPIEKMAMVMRMPGEGHGHHRNLYLTRQGDLLSCASGPSILSQLISILLERNLDQLSACPDS